MKNYIIGIAGTKNSGKDTVASMINYIFAVGVTRASYGNYIIKKKHTYDFYKDRIIHFADGLKDALSIIYNIPRDKFDDRDAKDNMYYNIKSCKFVPSNIVENKHNVEIITIDRLKNFNINTILRCSENRFVYIKLRTLMQYFGTDVCRNLLSDDIWIRQTMNKAVNIAETRKLCIIPDVRFANEAEAIQSRDASLYGGLIMINRNSSGSAEHSSENVKVVADFNIDNNRSLMMLFYQVLAICQKII